MPEEKRASYPARRLSRQGPSSKIDKFLIKLAVCFVTALLLAQCLLLPSQGRKLFSIVDRMEGEKISFSISDTDYKSLPNTENPFSRMSKIVNKSLSAIRPEQKSTE